MFPLQVHPLEVIRLGDGHERRARRTRDARDGEGGVRVGGCTFGSAQETRANAAAVRAAVDVAVVPRASAREPRRERRRGRRGGERRGGRLVPNVADVAEETGSALPASAGDGGSVLRTFVTITSKLRFACGGMTGGEPFAP